MIFLKYLPFSLHWITKRCIGGGAKTILDLGCGDGGFMKVISFKENWHITGVELYEDSLKMAKKNRVYSKVFKSDITKLPNALTTKKFDVVVLIQVIEHLKKELGMRELKKWQKLATRRIVVSTPVGFIEYDRVEKKDKEKNKLQKHLSGWEPADFTSRGYRVYGQGVRFIYGEKGLIRKMHPMFWPVLILISYILSPIVYFFPSLGTYMIAVKDIRVE